MGRSRAGRSGEGAWRVRATRGPEATAVIGGVRVRQAGWYVIQVQTGREQQMCRVIERVCAEVDLASDEDEQLLEECFSPTFQTEHKFGGEWKQVEKLLLPGYVIAVTARPGEVVQQLRRTPEFTRLLSTGETFVPLRDDERAWMEEFTKRGERTIAMSVGYREGDRVVVTQGPLKGREGIVSRVNRKKCLATIVMLVDAIVITTTVGLAMKARSGE